MPRGGTKTLGVDAYLESEKDDCAALLSWCAAHGVLALPLHEAETLALRHSWMHYPCRRRTTHARTARGWLESIDPLAARQRRPRPRRLTGVPRLGQHSGLWHTRSDTHEPRQRPA